MHTRAQLKLNHWRYQLKKCAECGAEFEFKTHNQKYCSYPCCRKATNKKIMEKYYEKKDRLNGKPRHCKCGAPISRYNPEDICQVCVEKEKKENKKAVKEAMTHVSKYAAKASKRENSRRRLQHK